MKLTIDFNGDVIISLTGLGTACLKLPEEILAFFLIWASLKFISSNYKTTNPFYIVNFYQLIIFTYKNNVITK